ncbi:MAG: hypothetical protein ABS52_05945 [Gemmatimonadetes bacterium SCN 70-22]|nr:MAG: hypothetical protein ABS52_05945 [Gemmatimonadetes bacterium SCN 70-22]
MSTQHILRQGALIRRLDGRISKLESVSGPGLRGAIVVADNDLIEVVPNPAEADTWVEVDHRAPEARPPRRPG